MNHMRLRVTWCDVSEWEFYWADSFALMIQFRVKLSSKKINKAALKPKNEPSPHFLSSAGAAAAAVIMGASTVIRAVLLSTVPAMLLMRTQ